MSRRTFTVPVKTVGGVEWGDLSSLGLTHEFVGERADLKNGSLSFAGGHRVRHYVFKKNVHWRLPGAADFDISAITPADEPPRKKMRGQPSK